jgi:hypothetical protein
VRLILVLTNEETMNQLNPYTKTSTIPTQDKAEHSSIAFVQSCWRKEIADQCRIACLDEVAKCNPQLGVDSFEVPGAFEIPLQAKLLARPRRDRSVANAHGPDAPDEGSAIHAVAVTDQVTWRLVPALAA